MITTKTTWTETTVYNVQPEELGDVVSTLSENLAEGDSVNVRKLWDTYLVAHRMPERSGKGTGETQGGVSMKIVDNRESKEWVFALLKCGDIFEYENKMWMKIQEGNGYNAVTLENGFLGRFRSDTKVNAVDAWLEVE